MSERIGEYAPYSSLLKYRFYLVQKLISTVVKATNVTKNYSTFRSATISLPKYCARVLNKMHVL
jgi:hypothetical protein